MGLSGDSSGIPGTKIIKSGNSVMELPREIVT